MDGRSQNVESTIFDQPDQLRDCYPMTKDKLGYVYVFNHTTFDNDSLETRYGSTKDSRDIEEVFQNLKFVVIIYNDLTYREILEKLSNIAEMDYSNFECLVIFVLTHGKKGKIFARDIDYYPDVYWKSFNERSSFMCKPKLIFIQAPRGDEVDDGVKIKPLMQTDVSVPTTYSIPCVPDVLLVYSCYDVFFSWRSRVTGSSFIQCLCNEFKVRTRNTDILTLLTFLNRRMSMNFRRLPNQLVNKQRNMAITISTLNRVLYFGSINK